MRDFHDALGVDRLDDLSAEDEIIVSSGRVLRQPDGVAYMGQDFTLRRAWSLRQLDCSLRPLHCQAVVRWLLFRDTSTLPEADQWATLWLKKDEAVLTEAEE